MIASTTLIITPAQMQPRTCAKLHKKQTHKLGKFNLLKISMTCHNLSPPAFLLLHLEKMFLIGILYTRQKIEFQTAIKTMLSLQQLIIPSLID